MDYGRFSWNNAPITRVPAALTIVRWSLPIAKFRLRQLTCSGERRKLRLYEFPTTACRIPELNTDFALHRSLAAPSSFTGSGASRWSKTIADRYRLELSDELVDWFDGGVCDQVSVGDFCEPATPHQLILETPDCIWPGFMPPDVLPLVGNGIGDWLCGRVTADNRIGEIIYWYHGGGDYLPYGNGLAEAIFFDTLAERLPGRRQFHAVPAYREPSEYQSMVSGPLVAWAKTHLPSSSHSVLAIDAPPSLVSSKLRSHGIAPVALTCDAVLAALDTTLRMRMTVAEANALNVSWERDAAKWMFDTSLIPAEKRSWLMARWHDADESLFDQDWDAVQSGCKSIADSRDDLGWVNDCLGWCAQRRGDFETAKAHYQRSAVASIFSDQAVRFRTHFDSDRVAKFSVARLMEMGADHGLDAEYVAAISDVSDPNWRARVSDHWSGKANGDHVRPEQRYELMFRAGWDVGCNSMQRYHELLVSMADAAGQSSQFARAEVARTHAACIATRFG